MQNESWPIVLCPGCKIQMEVQLVEPGNRDDTFIFKCPRCACETERVLRRPLNAPAPFCVR
jgi:hypothetical protein